jgi:hypothetical protein
VLDATREIWEPVPRASIYAVSYQGNVRSLPRSPRRGRPTGRVLQPWVKNGYPAVTLTCDDGERRKFYVHHLVARVFIGPRPAGLHIRHLDGHPANNAAWNLAYGTRSENMLDTLRHGTNYWANQTHCKNGHEFTPENIYTAPGTRSRQCRICHAATMEQFVQRQAALKAAALK